MAANEVAMFKLVLVDQADYLKPLLVDPLGMKRSRNGAADRGDRV
jgi:hypothetical protein